MRLKKLYLIGALSLFCIFSCTKDKITTYPVPGLYLGTYTVDNLPAQGALSYSIVVNPDGSLITKVKGGDGNNYYSDGTWTMTGTEFKGTISTFVKYNGDPVTQSITATFSNDGKLTNGVWKDLTNPTGVKNAGKLSPMQRVN